MSINKESDVAANLQIGPTNLGMVRIYVVGDGVDLPLDFDPEEADEIAEELRLAAIKARSMAPANKSAKSKPDHPKGPRPGPQRSKPTR